MSDVRAIDELFGELIELDSPEQRQEFLSRVGQDDRALREQLENLVAAHERAGSFLRDDGEVDATAAYQRDDLSGTTIGPYKLRERLGAGGMGVVWAAEQKKPLRRKVALKLIKPGMDTEQVLARFDAERAALALMDHPNIARVLDAGTTEQQRPYFVMELIRGVPITEYCDAKRLTIHQRLALFMQVCKAVQHAHQKGIIHRDIKPSNVLVTEQDGEPVPKVIDFGVAKALHQPLTDRSLYSGVFQAIGTLAYMSPEQAGLSASDVDTRADIYGLGVLLYELLTGSTPFGKEELASAALDEACRVIREKDPPKPSTRISTLGDRAAEIGRDRGVDAHRLGKLVRGDLDWILLRCLEKDRSRRYETASDLSLDLYRHLRGETVSARPPTFLYRTSRFLARNRVAVVTFAVCCSCLIAGLGIAAVSWSRAEHLADQRQQTLRRIMDWCMIEALSGDDERNKRAMEVAIAANAKGWWREMMQGAFLLESRTTDEAIDRLERSVELRPQSVAARSLLRTAYSRAGRSLEMHRESERLGRLVPETAEDFLFLGQATKNQDYVKRAVEFLDSPLALAIRAEVSCSNALGTRDTALADQAYDDIRRARKEIVDNDYLDSILLLVLHTRMRLEKDESDHWNELKQQADQAAERLNSCPDNLFAATQQGWYYCHTRQDVKADQSWSRVADLATRRKLDTNIAAAYRYRRNTDDALLLLTTNHMAPLIAKGVLLMETPASQPEALQVFDDLVDQELPATVLPSLCTILAWQGNADEFRSRSNEFLKRLPEVSSSEMELEIHRQILNLYARDHFPELKAFSNGEQFRLYEALGTYYLAHRDLEKAKENFQKALDTDMFQSDVYVWIDSIVRRMDESDWGGWQLNQSSE